MASAADEWWLAVADGLADGSPEVVLAAVAAANKLFDAAAAAPHGGAAALRAGARRTAVRVCLGMGPLMDAWRMMPSHAQVPVATLMGHIVAAIAGLDSSSALDPELGGGGGGEGGDDDESAGQGGSVSAALAGAVAYLSGALGSLNPAVKLEAARVLLRISAQSRGLPPLSTARVAAAVPPSAAAAAVAALLELKERVLVEAALPEVIGLVAGHLDVLPVPARVGVLPRLWPMIALLQSPTDRTAAFTAAWRTALDMHLAASAELAKGAEPPEGAVLLPALLGEPFIADVLAARAAPVPAAFGPGGAGPGALLPSVHDAANPGSGGGFANVPNSPAAAGWTGASLNTASAAAAEASSPADASAAAAARTPRESDGDLPLTPGGSGGKRAALQSALASGAKTMTDTLSSAAVTAADLARSAGISLPRLFDGPAAAARGAPPASLKQELACALLGVLARHPSASLALQLPAGAPVEPPPAAEEEGKPTLSKQPSAGGSSAAAGQADLGPPSPAADLQPPPAAALPLPPSLAPLHPNAAAHGDAQERAVLWLDAAVAALQATGACLHWEPMLPPPLPGQPPAPRLPAVEAANLSTVPADAWLRLMQGACAAARAVLRAHGHRGLKSVYRAHAGRMLPRLTLRDGAGHLARLLERAAITQQALIQRTLTAWRTLALAVRPRALWVAAHYLELPSMLEETWATLLACVEDTLLRTWRLEADAHTRLLAASAREGVLFKGATLPQLGTTLDKAGAAQFDAAAASALVELPEYRADGLQAALCVLQYLAWTVQAGAAAQRDGRSGPGPAEAALARRLLEVVRAAAAAEATGVDLKEWCRRMSRALAAAADQEAAGGGAQGAGRGGGDGPGGPAFTMAPPPARAAGALPGGYNPVAGFNALGFGGGGSSSSDDDDDADDAGSSSGPDPSKGSSDRGADSEESDASASSSDNGSDNGSDSSSSSAQQRRRRSAASPRAANGADGEGAALKSPRAAGRARRRAARAAEREAVARANAAVGNPEASSGAWGYPFTGPRARTLFISRRSRRHRLMRWHVAAALASGSGDAADGGAGPGGGLTFAGAGATDDTGPVFDAGSGFRLDKRAFWDSLLPGSGASSPWRELTGPSDPVAVSARYDVGPLGALRVALRAHNRLPSDVDGARVAVRLAGPVRPERREAEWALPRLLPTEAAAHAFELLPTGYGRIELHARVLLPVGGEASVPALRCAPLAVSMAHMLRAPRGAPAGPSGFLDAWAALPVGAELPVVAAWPGADGLLLALSGLARAPLACAWRRALPVVGGAQAAYLAAPASSPADVIALVVTLQLMPPATWEPAIDASGSAAGGAAGGGDSDADDGSSTGRRGDDDHNSDGSSGGSKKGSSSRRAAGGDKAGKPAAPSAVEAALRLAGGMRAVGHVAVRSSSHEAALAVRDHAAAWVRDLAGGALSLGLAPPRVAPSDRPLLHPSIAPLAAAFRAAPPAVPLPPHVPEPELPPPPQFKARVRTKRDEEDSDGDDEALPPTAEEEAVRRAALDEHRDECKQVRRKHREALAARAAAMLHRSALAEWRRLSGAA